MCVACKEGVFFVKSVVIAEFGAVEGVFVVDVCRGIAVAVGDFFASYSRFYGMCSKSCAGDEVERNILFCGFVCRRVRGGMGIARAIKKVGAYTSGEGVVFKIKAEFRRVVKIIGA